MAFMYVVLVPMMALSYWGVKAIKKYITYPRTGYVAFRPVRKSGRAIVFFVSMVVAAAFVFFAVRFGRGHYGMALTRAVFIVGMVAPYGGFAFSMRREHRWKWIVLAGLAAGLVATSWAVPGDMVAYFRPASLLVGLVWVGSGVATLCIYLQRTQAPIQEPE